MTAFACMYHNIVDAEYARRSVASSAELAAERFKNEYGVTDALVCPGAPFEPKPIHLERVRVRP